jgi:flagellar motility protein MotE (MotC chaperone)
MKQNLIIYAIGFLVVAGFAISVLAGFNVGHAQGIAAGRHWRDNAFALEKATMALNLSADQRARVDPFVVEAGPRLTAIEADARKKKHDVIDNTLAQIRPLLRPEQQKKLDELQKAREDLHSAKDRVRALTSE